MLSKLFIFCCCSIMPLLSFSQSDSYLKKGDACMDKEEYEKASIYYRKAAENAPKSVKAYRKLGKALVAAQDYSGAESTYALLCADQPDSTIDHFNYAQVLRRNGKYAEADKEYQTYFKEHSDDPLAADFIYFGANINQELADTMGYKLTNIAENSSADDEGPTFCLYSLCFSSNRHTSEDNYDLYIRQAGNPTNTAAPEKLKGDLNNKLYEGPAAFSHNGKEIIFTRSNYEHKSYDGRTRLGLYHASYDPAEKKWVNITPLNFVDFDYNFEQPSLSKDDTTLYFVSDMRGGQGSTDIYVSYKRGNTWSNPVNLGKHVNTPGREQTPYIADDGTLYFASDSRPGFGGLDIYSIKATDGVWGYATNVGRPINSHYDDFGYINDVSGNSGYIVSNRPGGKGGNDIYQFLSLKK